VGDFIWEENVSWGCDCREDASFAIYGSDFIVDPIIDFWELVMLPLMSFFIAIGESFSP